MNSRIRAVTRAAVNQAACTGGRGAVFNGTEPYNGTTSPNTLPWHVQYETFEGILPNITAVNIILSRFRFGITVAGICTGQFGSATDAISERLAIGVGGVSTTVTPVEGRNTATLIRTDGGICGNGRMRNVGELFQLNTTIRIAVRLI